MPTNSKSTPPPVGWHQCALDISRRWAFPDMGDGVRRAGQRREGFFVEKTALNRKRYGGYSQVSGSPPTPRRWKQRLSSYHEDKFQKSMLSTDPVSVEAATGQLSSDSTVWFTRRIRLKVAASTDAGSAESQTFQFCSLGVARQSLLPPTRGRRRARRFSFVPWV